MEVLILGWYVLVETGSVHLLVLFAALQYFGSLLSPLFGVAGDRVGYRRLLYLTRALYALLAALIGTLAALHLLTPVHVLAIAAVAGLVRPSDMMLRNALIAQTIPPAQLLGALGLSRSTADTARIAGALAGAGAVAAFGMVPAYVVVTLLYTASFLLSLGVAGRVAPVGVGIGAVQGQTVAAVPAATPATDSVFVTAWRDLRSAFAYVWHKPPLLGALALAFLVNFLAFPFVNGLLPYVANNIYVIGQTGLGYLAASFAGGGLLGSILLVSNRLPLRAARTAIAASAVWFIANFCFTQVTHLGTGIVLLMCAGVAHNFCLTPIVAVMLRESEPEYRGRVMGMRMLAIWGLPAGLLLAGPLISRIGFAAAGALYSVTGLVLVAAIALYWRAHLWRADAPGNARA